MKPGVARLFLSVEVRQCREDEGSDGANELNPIVNLHARHLLPSRKKADTSDYLPQKIYHTLKIFSSKSKLTRRRKCGKFLFAKKTVLRQAVDGSTSTPSSLVIQPSDFGAGRCSAYFFPLKYVSAAKMKVPTEQMSSIQS